MTNPTRQRLGEFLDRGGLGPIKPEHRPMMLDLLEAFVNLMNERGVSADDLLDEVQVDGGSNA